MNKTLYNFVSWFMVFGQMGLIFYFSSQPREQSSQMSRGIAEIVYEAVRRSSPRLAERIDPGNLHRFIRKNAHFLLFMILGTLTANAMKAIGGSRMESFIICIVYAVFDEIHQEFVPGRAGELRDIFIDGAGALCGIWLFAMFDKIRGVLFYRRA